MKPRSYLLLVAISILLVAAPARTARRPRYGGTLRLEIDAVLNSLDPAVTPSSPAESAAKQQLDALLYDHRDPDGAFSGAGPFRISAWEPGRHVVLAANEDAPGGRPFVDTIGVEMGRPAGQRLLDLELNQTDFAEIPPAETREAIAHGIRVSASDPDELIAIAFLAGGKFTADQRPRQALSLALDRGSIANFILQKEGQAAGGILPQWCSGTAFLFPSAQDLTTARQLWSQISGSPKLVLGYDSSDTLEREIAERIVVDAQQAGLSIVPRPIDSNAASEADARLIRWRMPSPHARAALADFVTLAGPLAGLDATPLPDPASADQIYEREAQIIGGFRVIPLAWLPRVYGLSSRVRDWKAPAPGEAWPLASVWLDEGAQ